MPLSKDEFILTHLVIGDVVDTEPTAIAIRYIVMVSPCGTNSDWSDITVVKGDLVEEMTIATPFGELIPTS